MVKKLEIDRGTANAYCHALFGAHYRDGTSEERLHRANSKAEYLEGKEWQRWTPGVGAIRKFKDFKNGDYLLLERVYSEAYDKFNNIYNFVATTALLVGGGIALESLALKLFGQ